MDIYSDGYRRYSGDLQYVSASSFKTAGNQTSVFPVGARVRFTQVASGVTTTKLSPADHFGLAASFTTLSASDSTVKTAIEKAKLPMIGGVQPYVSQNVINLTV